MDVSARDFPEEEFIPVELWGERTMLVVFYHYRYVGNKVICLNVYTDRFRVADDSVTSIPFVFDVWIYFIVRSYIIRGITKQSLCAECR
jgi:hypothetical protein